MTTQQPRVRAVVLDIGGVLEQVDDHAWPPTWLDRWARRSTVAAEDLEVALEKHAPTGDVRTGEVSEAELRAAYAEALALTDEQADAMMSEMWDAYCGKLDQELFDHFVSLRGTVLLGILSNSADGARREEARRYGFPDVVDVLIYSHEVGLAKPDPDVYRLVMARLGVAPAEIAFVDDTAEQVAAAREAGWQALLHQDTATTIAWLRSLVEPAGVG